MQSKLILHPDNKSKSRASHVTICLAKVRRSDEADFTKNVQVAIDNFYQEKKINKLTFQNPTLFRKDNQVTTFNMEPTGEDKLFLTGLHQHLLTTIGDQIQQDQDHGYTPHLTMFTKKPNLSLPDLLPEELQLCNTDTIHRVDGESQYTKTHPIKILPSALSIRRLGSAEVISSLRYDQASASIIPDTLAEETNMKTEQALMTIIRKAKSHEGSQSKPKILRHLAKDLNKLCQNTLENPVESATRLFSLATTCSTTEILQQELKNLLAPESCNDWRCRACLKCQV